VTAPSYTFEGHTETNPMKVSAPGKARRKALMPNPGDHVHSKGAWPERGLLRPQFDPRKNGTLKW
jgi:hypothetical protein